MLGSFGGWLTGTRLGWRSRAFAGRAALGLLLPACAGETLVVGAERPGSELIAAQPNVLARDAGARPSGVALTQDCPTSPGERQALLGCWPTRHLGRWSGFFIGAPRYETQGGEGAEFPSGGLVLVLSLDGGGELIFGAATAPDEGEPCADTSSARCASVGRVLPGFAYRLDQVELFDPSDDGPTRVDGEPPPRVAEHMQFLVLLGQPWESWCAEQPALKGACGAEAACTEPSRVPAPSAVAPGAADASSAACRCSESGCRPNATSLSISLRMSDDGQALRGLYTPASGGVDPARLEFTREREP
jgi:hypothetical protein